MRTLAGFGSTAAIGTLTCGAALDDVVAAFGPPWDIGRVGRRRQWPRLLSYGDAEFCVCRCRRVTLISVQTWRDVIELPVPGTRGLAVSAGLLTGADVMAGLGEAGCRLMPVTAGQPPGQSALRAEPTGVTFTFRSQDGSEPLLVNVGHWTVGHECVPPLSGSTSDR
ncbi:hypothetical protein [Streptomyces sp. bgisy091]|uniref:hypothetical protein n=1 Tax=Streptomyces sp. bgisy091 TaxID=3413778 RepID=UPI003D706773